LPADHLQPLEPGEVARDPGRRQPLAVGELLAGDARVELDRDEELDLAAGDAASVRLVAEVACETEQDRSELVRERDRIVNLLNHLRNDSAG